MMSPNENDDFACLNPVFIVAGAVDIVESTWIALCKSLGKVVMFLPCVYYEDAFIFLYLATYFSSSFSKLLWHRNCTAPAYCQDESAVLEDRYYSSTIETF
jgi:hypothetical protein